MRILLIISIVILLNSCGFKPVYSVNSKLKNGENFKEELAAIEVKVSQVGKKKYIDQKLKNTLEEILNPNYIAVDPKYLLVIKLTTNETSSFITASGTSGRSWVNLNASYNLKDASSNEVIFSSSTSAGDNNNITDNRFANYVSSEVIEMNLVKIIAKNIRNSIINDFTKGKQEEKCEEVEDSEECD